MSHRSTAVLFLFLCYIRAWGLSIEDTHTHTHTHTHTRQMLPQHIWFVSHHQWTLSHGNTHESSLKLNYSPHSVPPSVHLLLLLSLSFSRTHTQSRRSNVYQVREVAGCPATSRSDAEQRSRAIKSLLLFLLSSHSSSFIPRNLLLRGSNYL